MLKALNGVIGKLCFVFIDDILIFSKHRTDHLGDIESILKHLRSANLSVKLEKCKFFAKEIEFLGHRVSKIRCIQNKKLQSMDRPKNVVQLQRFLGLAIFFRKFIPVFSRLADPLYKLLRKEAQFEWTDACENSFNKLKGSLVSDTVLAHPDYSKPFYLFTDASDLGLGACLMHSTVNH